MMIYPILKHLNGKLALVTINEDSVSHTDLHSRNAMAAGETAERWRTVKMYPWRVGLPHSFFYGQGL